jgi:hypothetical protein
METATNEIRYVRKYFAFKKHSNWEQQHMKYKFLFILTAHYN